MHVVWSRPTAVSGILPHPGDVLIVIADGDLYVVCNKPGYHTSKVIFRAPLGLDFLSFGIGAADGSGGIGSAAAGLGVNLPLTLSGKEKVYPSRVLIDMGPL